MAADFESQPVAAAGNSDVDQEALGSSAMRDYLEQAIKAPGFSEHERLYSEVVARWGATRQRQIDQIARHFKGEVPEAALRLEAHVRAEADFTAAYSWACALPFSTQRSLALASVFYQVGLDAPREAIVAAEGAPLEDMKYVVMQNLVLQWSKTDFSAAAEWLSSRPAAAWRDRTLEQLGLARAEADL